MKLSFGILVNVVCSELAYDTLYGDAVNDRQFSDKLTEQQFLVLVRWRRGGAVQEEKFDPAKHWTYGCHCSIGSYQHVPSMYQHVPTGQPVDAFDQACRQHTQCLNCVRDKHGEDCNHDTVQYTWRYSNYHQKFEPKGEFSFFLLFN